MPPDQLGLDALLKGQVSVTPEEHPDDRAARIRREERTARIEDYKGLASYVLLALLILLVALVSSYEGVFDAAAPPET